MVEHLLNFPALIDRLGVMDDMPAMFCKQHKHDYCETCGCYCCEDPEFHRQQGHTVVEYQEKSLFEETNNEQQNNDVG